MDGKADEVVEQLKGNISYYIHILDEESAVNLVIELVLLHRKGRRTSGKGTGA